MAGTKRAAEDDGAGPAPRATKAPKTDAKARKGGKKGPKANMAAGAFKARALPLHVNITHTPPVAAEGAATAAAADPGFVATTALLPATFATGSYGWKGNKRLTIELDGADGAEKEKVHVMLTINATVMGSKGAKDSDEVPEDKEEHADEATEEVHDGDADEKPEDTAVPAVEAEAEAATA